MMLRFILEDVLLFEGGASAIPPPGSEIVFRLQQSTGNFERGSLVAGKVSVTVLTLWDFEIAEPELVVDVPVCDLRPHDE